MKTICVVLIASVLASGYAQAQQTQSPSQSSREQKRQADKGAMSACANDIKTLCTGKTGSAAKACLQSNESKLSSECKSAMSSSPPPTS